MYGPNNPVYYKAKSIYDFRVEDLHGAHYKLDMYKGCVCIIVNIATKSKLTDLHYKQFNDLMDKYGESEGLRIVAFPCNQFEQEEPGSEEDILDHAEIHDVRFDIFAKVNVNCANAIPLYKFMKKRLRGHKLGDMVKSNYTKFIINRKGMPVERHGPGLLQSELEKVLEFYFKQHMAEKIVKPLSQTIIFGIGARKSKDLTQKTDNERSCSHTYHRRSYGGAHTPRNSPVAQQMATL